MNTRIRNLFLLPVLLAGLGLMLACPVTAQTFKVLHSFSPNSQGSLLASGLVSSGSSLYGTAASAGTWGSGTVFKINADGTGFAVLHTFKATDFSNGINSDGAAPLGLLLSGNTIYGTATLGGSSGNGTVYKVNTDGTGFEVLHSFGAVSGLTNSDGVGPLDGLVLSGNTIYGTAQTGGSSGRGTVYKVNTDGTGFKTLHSFTAALWSPDSINPTNSDGGVPEAGMVLSGNVLYGTAGNGGPSGSGTLFSVNTDGSGFATLYSFTATQTQDPHYTNSDGAGPVGLVLSGSTLYGTAASGGTWGRGTVFAVKTDGTGFSTLYAFSAGSDSSVLSTNSDGKSPTRGLVLSGNTLYGTADVGGIGGCGTVFGVNTDGSGFTTLYSFTTGSMDSFGNVFNSDGAEPEAGLVLSGSTLYGTAASGGTGGGGTVFSLSLPTAPPLLTLTPAGPNVILTWPTNAAGFTLQSTTDLGSAAVWTTNTPVPVVVNDQNVVTNPISGSQMFFRLSQ